MDLDKVAVVRDMVEVLAGTVSAVVLEKDAVGREQAGEPDTAEDKDPVGGIRVTAMAPVDPSMVVVTDQGLAPVPRVPGTDRVNRAMGVTSEPAVDLVLVQAPWAPDTDQVIRDTVSPDVGMQA